MDLTQIGLKPGEIIEARVLADIAGEPLQGRGEVCSGPTSFITSRRMGEFGMGRQHHADEPAHRGADPIDLLGAKSGDQRVHVGAVLRIANSRRDPSASRFAPARRCPDRRRACRAPRTAASRSKSRPLRVRPWTQTTGGLPVEAAPAPNRHRQCDGSRRRKGTTGTWSWRMDSLAPLMLGTSRHAAVPLRSHS